MPNEFFLSVGLIFNAMIIYFAIAKNVKQGMQESVRLESRLTKIETILEQILSERK